MKNADRVLGVGGLIIAIGTGIGGFSNSDRWPHTAGIILFIAGVIVALISFIRIRRGFKMYSKWDEKTIEESLLSAPNDATIRILQTWLPDKERFCPFLENLLIKGEKRFSIEVFFMDYEHAADKYGLLQSRIRSRHISSDKAINEIEMSIELLKQMKKRVDDAWKKMNNGARVNLNIKTYNIMPFGPMFQIGKDVLYFGMYHNYDTAIIGPMFKIKSNNGNWDKIVRNLDELSMGSGNVEREIDCSNSEVDRKGGEA